MIVDLTEVIKTAKGQPCIMREEKLVKSSATLSNEAKMAAQSFLLSLPAPVQEELNKFFGEYIVKTEFNVRDMVVRDILQTVLTTLSNPKGKALVKSTFLLPKVDDSCNQLELSDSDVEWLVHAVVNASPDAVGSLLKSRILYILDPEGKLLEKYGDDTGVST